MSPGPRVPLRSLRRQAYDVLDLHYVEGLTIQEVAKELAVSERQVYRELRKAEAILATLLWPRLQSAVTSSQSVTTEPSRVELVRQEAARLGSGETEVEAQTLVEGAMTAVRALAQHRAVRLELTGKSGPNRVVINRAIARQVFIAN